MAISPCQGRSLITMDHPTFSVASVDFVGGETLGSHGPRWLDGNGLPLCDSLHSWMWMKKKRLDTNVHNAYTQNSFFGVDTYMCVYVQYTCWFSGLKTHYIRIYIRMVHKFLVHFYAMRKLGPPPIGSEDFCVLRLWSSSLLSNRHDWCILWAYCLLTFLDWFVFSLDFLFLCFSLENHRKPKETHRIHTAPNQRNQRIPKEKSI